MKRTALRWLSALTSLTATVGVAVAMPPNPTRVHPPPGVEERALPPGTAAPAVSLPSASGGAWSLAQARADGPAVLVFYRGDW